MTAWLDNARSILVLSCSKAVRKNRNWTAARTDVVRPGESFYKDGTASCGPALAGSDEEVRLSHDAKRGRSRSCVVLRVLAQFSGSEDHSVGSLLCRWPMSRSRSRKTYPCCSIKRDRRVRTVRTSATIRVNSASSAPVGVRMVAAACSFPKAYFRRCSLAGGPGEKPKTPP